MNQSEVLFETANGELGRIALLFELEEGTDKVEKAQAVSGQFIKTRK